MRFKGRVLVAMLAALCYVGALGGYLVLAMAPRRWPWGIGAILLTAAASLVGLAVVPRCR